MARYADALRRHAPTVAVLVNAVAFYFLRPGVPDLWAARARASAASHGVGLTYWFGWFGGSTPGNYSVITPYLCSALGTEAALGLAAVLTSVFVTALVARTRRPVAAGWVAAVGITLNLWCGRVPFVVGAAFATAALVAVLRRRTVPAAVLTVLSVLASPVAGVFLALGLSGLLMPRFRDRRPTALVCIGVAGAALLALMLLFGAPGPEPFPLYLIAEVTLILGLIAASRPPGHLRTTLAVSAAVVLGVFIVPNGLGANVARLALFCLPPAMVALSGRRPRVLLALTVPILVLGVLSSMSALISASRPGSTARFYAPLAAELDTLHLSANHRLEVVNAGHAANAVLLGHAVLARGWETQQDLAQNRVLHTPGLDASAFRTWLNDNAVGYVAVVNGNTSATESRAVVEARGSYLREIWRAGGWELYRVLDAAPIVAAPAVLETSSQAAMTVRVPCACRTSVRIRWSDYLSVEAALPARTPEAVEDSYRPVLVDNGSGWTTLTTNRPGTYTLDGS